MYQTSADYKTAMRSASRPYDTVYGTVTLTTGTEIDLDSSIMPTNAISISKQCIDNGELMFGGVFLSTLKLSILTDLSRYAFYGAEIELFYKVQTGTETVGTSEVPVYEEVPLGVYVVAEADRPSDRVNITAYDKMRLLDVELGAMTITGTPWEILSTVAEQTGYPLGFEESYLTTFINSTYPITTSEEQGIKTYRDVVKVVCQQLGCFALDDRTGQLMLKKFSMNADLLLHPSDWYSIVPADYICNYVALSITSLKGTFVKTDPNPNLVGNMMIIEDAPAWDYGLDTVLDDKTTALFNYLTDIDYTPCDIEMPADPSFDCGDRLGCTLRDGTTISTLITSYEWKFHQGMTVTSEGINPYLEGGSALATESQRILTQAVEKSKLQFVTFTNPSEKIIGDDETVVIGETSFTPTTQANALFVATILVDADVDDVMIPVKVYNGTTETVVTDLQGNTLTLKTPEGGECTAQIKYSLKADNGEEIFLPTNEDPYIATEELTDGRHIITVSYPLNALTEYVRFTFKVYMTAGGGTITIPAHTLQATIFGQEITTMEAFSGQIVVDENFDLLVVGTKTIFGLEETIAVNVVNSLANVISEDFECLTVGGYPTRNYVLDESGEQILDEDGEPIEGEQEVVTSAIIPPTATEQVTLYMEIDESYLMRCGDGFYCGDDFATGLYNTLI